MDLIVSVKGIRIKAKNLDADFYEFIRRDLENSGVELNRDNSVESLFRAYLQLAARTYNYDKKIEDMIKDIDSNY
jgi:hypothetical protein